MQGVWSSKPTQYTDTKRFLMFLPTFTFIAIMDLHVFFKTVYHQPIAYEPMPGFVRWALNCLAGASFLSTVACYLFAILAISSTSSKLQLVGICFIIKIACWSPFLAVEFYDTVFEHLYYDVAY